MASELSAANGHGKDRRSHRLTEEERRVLSAVKDDVALDEVQVAVGALVPTPVTTRALQQLEKKGFVRVTEMKGRVRYVRAHRVTS
jgi:DNA-binding MarR family transcriptional regulator